MSADPLLAARRYDVVQAMQDDVNAAFADGLAYEQAATPPALTETQRADAVTVRDVCQTVPSGSRSLIRISPLTVVS